jgi:hypothetical protein
LREESLHGEPKPTTSIERTCRTCGASFVKVPPGKTGEAGIWIDWAWYCSIECAPDVWRQGYLARSPSPTPTTDSPIQSTEADK